MRVLLVGWDSADWKIIDPLLERGEMPNLAGILAAGVRGNIATLHPALSPMLWTSIATGKRPPKHGILGFTEPTPDGLNVQPITNLGRKTKAVWNILNQHGKRSIVVGWWPSHPAEPIRGAMVSDRFPLKTSQPPGAPIPRGAVWPPKLADALADLRVHGIEITGEMLRMFAPHYDRVNQEDDKSVHDLAGLIAESVSIHAAATELIETEPWDFAALYYVGLDHFSHRFMRYHAGKAINRAGTRVEIFEEVVRNAYRYHDAMLGRLLELAGPECAVMLVSDHGFHSDRHLPDYIPAEGAGPSVEHRDYGIFCLRAPGVVAGERVYGATVLDVAPTLLHLFGLPTGQDMDGKVLVNAFRDRPVPDSIPSWDDVPGEDGSHPPERRRDNTASEETLRQLIALGYVAPTTDTRQAVERCRVETRYNLAQAWLDAGRPDEAAPILRLLLAEDPNSLRFCSLLLRCLMILGEDAEATLRLDRFDAVCETTAPEAVAEIERRQQVRPTSELSLQMESPDRIERLERQQLAEQATGHLLARRILRCELALASGKRNKNFRPVYDLLAQLEEAIPHSPQLARFTAGAYAEVGRADRALAILHDALRDDPESADLLSLEARIHHQAGRHEEAAKASIASLSLLYFQPYLHFILGVALDHMGDREQGLNELRVAIAQSPNLAPAHQALAKILARQPDAIGQVSLHLAKADKGRKLRKARKSALRPAIPEPPPVFERLAAPPSDRSGLVVIVSGLPRSGTSMMMQMLRAAGIDPYTDAQREADEDNPRGYFEHAHATQLYRDSSWLPQAQGKVVKIVAQLLPHLPTGSQYRIVFLHRDLAEVVASQHVMLTRLGRVGAALSESDLKRAFTTDLARVQDWLDNHPEIPVLPVTYAATLADPAATAARLAEFLGAPFNRPASAAAVSSTLRRQKNS